MTEITKDDIGKTFIISQEKDKLTAVLKTVNEIGFLFVQNIGDREIYLWCKKEVMPNYKFERLERNEI